MKKTKNLVYCLALANLISVGAFRALSTPTTAYASEIQQGTVSASALNVRSGASTSSKAIGQLKRNSKVEIISKVNGWYEIKYSGKTGYVSADYIKNVSNVKNSTKKNTTTSNQSEKVIMTGTVSASALNVRNGAGTSNKSIGTIKKGAKVEIISKAGNWYKIKYSGKTGYVSADYIKNISNVKNSTTTTTTNANNTKTTTTQSEKVIMTGTISASSLNVRDGASISHKAIGQLKRNSKVEIISKAGNWYKIKYSGKTGYVSADYIKNISKIKDTTKSKKAVTVTKANNIKTTTTQSVKTIMTGTISASSLNVRDGASISHKALGHLGQGSKVEIVGQTNGWYKIKFNKSYGYVSGAYVKNISKIEDTKNTTKTTTTITQSEKTIMTGTISASSLNVRDGASISHKALGHLGQGSKIEIVGQTNGWYKIKFNKSYGYVSGAYVNTSNDTKANTTNNDKAKTETKTETSKTKTGVVTDTSYLNVRKGAGTSFDKLGGLNGGATVEIIGENNGWYQIKYNDGIGYVCGDYIATETKESSNGITAINLSSKETMKAKLPTDNSYIVTTNYDITLDDYVAKQQATNKSYSKAYFKSYIDPLQAKNMFQFLRINTYRDVNVAKLNQMLKGKGVLEGQAQAIVNACKKQNIDPIYFTAQSLHETGNGTSRLARGTTITEIADSSHEIRDSRNRLTGYRMIKLDRPVTVYNLYGIGAYDNLSTFPNRAGVLGTTYAYNHGWTSIAKAIEGASVFVSSNYANSVKYDQNTLYKYKYNQNMDNLWHQYATTPWYAKEIGDTMQELKDCYTDSNSFVYDIPSFAQEA